VPTGRTNTATSDPGAPNGPAAVATVVMVPRDHFSAAPRAVRQLFDKTDEPFLLVYVDGGSPRRIRDAIYALQCEYDFVVLRSRRYLAPNQARRIGLAEVATPYVVFLDNDVLVQPGWLSSLLKTADETGAWMVGPLCAEGDPRPRRVHMVGGDIQFTGPPSAAYMEDLCRFAHRDVARLGDLRRERCDFAEFHCIVARVDRLAEIGGMDEQLLCIFEHIDLCLRATEAGGEIWVDPSAVITFAFPPHLKWSDLGFFSRRWSERAGKLDSRRFRAKYGLSAEWEAHCRHVVRSLRQNALVKKPKRWAGRVFGRRFGGLIAQALGLLEVAVNHLVARGSSPQVRIERIATTVPEGRAHADE
jgi:GT2 family glycosyltransferase